MGTCAAKRGEISPRMPFLFWFLTTPVDAHIAVVMAQLYTQGQSCGVHGFTVRLRDDTGQLRPGVRVADVGHKIGLNGTMGAVSF